MFECIGVLDLAQGHIGRSQMARPRPAVRPPTATDILTAVLGRDEAQRPAATTAHELADPVTRLTEAAAEDDRLSTALRSATRDRGRVRQPSWRRPGRWCFTGDPLADLRQRLCREDR